MSRGRERAAAERVIVNGNIHTVDSVRPYAPALASRANTLAASRRDER